MKVRRNVSRPDTSAWPEFDPGALTAAQRKTFGSRRRAVELFVADTSLAEIEAQTGVNRRQVYRSLEGAAVLHADGRPHGWRALVPHTRVEGYHRVTKVRRHAVGLGTAGAFGLLMEAHPPLVLWITEQVRAKRVSVDQISTDDGLRLRVRSLTKLHLSFLDQCRAVGLSSADYPFNTDHMGIRSLAAAVRAQCLRTFERGARLAGATHLKGLPIEAGSTPAAQQALDVVEFDGHRLDVRLKVVVRDPLGFEQEFEIERIWLLVIVCYDPR